MLLELTEVTLSLVLLQSVPPYAIISIQEAHTVAFLQPSQLP